MSAAEELIMIMISDDKELDWVQMMQNAWHHYGRIQILSETDVAHHIKSTRITPNLIMIDASTIQSELVSLVSKLCQAYQPSPVIVASASPTWKQARDVFHAGASDYVNRNSDVDRLIQLLKAYAENDSQNGGGE
ncbi:MAG: hypothetical protein WAS33_28345 [Candidatus Promineifilaceae bacterium]